MPEIVEPRASQAGLFRDRNEPSLFSKSEWKPVSGSRSMRAEFRFSLEGSSLTFDAKPLESEVTPSRKQLMHIIRQIAAAQPESVDSSRAIPLPFGLKKLWTSTGMLHGEA